MSAVNKAILMGTGCAMGMSLFLWITKMLPIFIWVTLPGWIFAWLILFAFHAQESAHRDALDLVLLTVGNAAAYSGFFLFILTRPKDG